MPNMFVWMVFGLSITGSGVFDDLLFVLLLSLLLGFLWLFLTIDEITKNRQRNKLLDKIEEYYNLPSTRSQPLLMRLQAIEKKVFEPNFITLENVENRIIQLQQEQEQSKQDKIKKS